MAGGSDNKWRNKLSFMVQSDPKDRRSVGFGISAGQSTILSQVTHVSHIEAGELNTYELEYLRLSADGDLVGVKKLFEEQSYYLYPLDVNCVDSLDRTALSLALLNRHIDVVEFLLSDEISGIELRDAIFYAIQCEFYDAIQVILDKDSQTSAQIPPGTTSPFEPGLTPFMLAANKNNYRILSMLFKHNHHLTFSENDVSKGNIDTYSWDAVMERLLHFRARASPAFMLLMYNENGMSWDPLNTSMELFGELKSLAKKEREVDEAYLQMSEQCETFALQLLQEVRSSSELADLMRYDLDDDPDEDDDPGESDRIIIEKKQKSRNYLKPIEKAIKYKMKDFVTSDNSQLALIYIQKGSLFRKYRGIRALTIQVVLGLMFPILCIASLIAPLSKIGRLMSNPSVKFGCSVVSELVFVFLLLANTIQTETEPYKHGEIPPLLIVAYAWIVGKCLQEVRELGHQGLKEYLADVWNWNDMFTILLFTGYMGLRISYKINNPGLTNDDFFVQDGMFHPIILSDVCISIAYILIHLRIFELLRADRRFGPLQVSLHLMTRDAVRFLVIFLIIFVAFGSGVIELYAPFGERKGCVCPFNHTDLSPRKSCKTTDDKDQWPTTLYGTLSALYWTMFGYSQHILENLGVTNCRENYLFTELTGTIIIYVYHIVAIIVLVNMLIAMMSNSFQKTHDDSEREWKFHRTQLWLKFIRNDIDQPPPMNLIPQPKQVRHIVLKLVRMFKHCTGKRSSEDKEEEAQMQEKIRMQRRRTGVDTKSNTIAGAIFEGETRYTKILRLVVLRYMKKKVLNNEMTL